MFSKPTTLKFRARFFFFLDSLHDPESGHCYNTVWRLRFVVFLVMIATYTEIYVHIYSSRKSQIFAHHVIAHISIAIRLNRAALCDIFVSGYHQKPLMHNDKPSQGLWKLDFQNVSANENPWETFHFTSAKVLWRAVPFCGSISTLLMKTKRVLKCSISRRIIQCNNCKLRKTAWTNVS